jgi:hypothetical protein
MQSPPGIFSFSYYIFRSGVEPNPLLLWPFIALDDRW